MTVKAIVVVAHNAPDVPVIVIVDIPAGVVLPMIRVSTLVPVAEFGLKDA